MQQQQGSHSFSIKDALEYGVHAAILLNNIRFWVATNEANKSSTHFHEGIYWTYNSKRAYSELMPYLSEAQVKHALNKLIDRKIIISGSFNKKGYDKTLWYALTTHNTLQQPSTTHKHSLVTSDQPLDTSIQPLDKNNQPIPDINTVINTDINKKGLVNMSSPLKDKDFPPESIVEKDKGKIQAGKSVAEIKEKHQGKLDAKLEEVEYLKDLTAFQIMNPREFKGSVSKGKKLSRIATDVYILFTHSCKKHYPDMGVIITPPIKDVKMMTSLMKKLDGDLDLLLLIVQHWYLFKKAAETTHSTTIKTTYPNLPIILKYAQTASTAVFLDKIATTTSNPKQSGKNWNDL